MDTDRELLRRYTQDGDEAAFTAVVYRHTDLVYSAALRLVNGDAHLAHDVAQKVFCTLALKAGSLRERDNLLGWLHTTTRYAASVAVRSERRRRHHEQEAAMNAHHDAPAEQLDWTQLQPLLDEAVGSLRVEDREAVLLRYFQGKSHREVGAELGLSETLARKRVERALEKLRTLLSRRGVTASSALLATTITAHAVQAAPAGYAAGFGSASLAAAAEAGSVGLVWPAILLIMKTKTVVLTSVLILGAALVGTWWWKNQSTTDAVEKPSAASRSASIAAAQVEPVRIAVAPVSSTDTVSAAATPPVPRTGPPKTASAPRASSSATGSVVVSVDARDNLNSTMQTLQQLVKDGDYTTLVRNYLPPKGDLQNTDPVAFEQSIQTKANNPAVQQTLQRLGQMLAEGQNTTPVFSSDGHSARLKIAASSDFQSLVFIQIHDSWYFSGFEVPPAPPTTSAPSPAAPLKHSTGTGGGYVP